jgi:integrase
MLAQFNELSALRRWFEAPGLLWSTASRPLAQGGTIQPWHAALARSALIAQIGQRVAPLRRINLVRLRYRGDDRHLHLPAGDGHGWLIIPAIETKTLKQIKVRIDPETVRLIKIYIETFLPVAQKAAKAGEDNPHLFPGAGGTGPEAGGYAPGQGYLTKEKLNATFSKHMKKYARLSMCLHVMRHICGKVILDQDPSAMGLVQQLLGHKSIDTTKSYYAEVCSIVAQNRYLHLLEQGMRKALAQYEFRIGAPQTPRRKT